MARYEIRHGKFGAYFHDTEIAFDMPLDLVLEALNRKEEYKRRLAKANEGRPIGERV